MIDLIVIHCAATKPGQKVNAEVIRKWHTEERGWQDIGYHAVILENGNIEKGRDWKTQGAHVRGHNKNSVGICLAGGLDADGNLSADYTDSQLDSLRLLVAGLKKRYPKAVVCGHNMLTNSKTCPNFDVVHWYNHRKVIPVF